MSGGLILMGVSTLLLDAGSPVEWKAGDEPAEGISEIVEGWRRG